MKDIGDIGLVARLKNADQCLIDAAWAAFPSPYEIDIEDDAMRRFLDFLASHLGNLSQG